MAILEVPPWPNPCLNIKTKPIVNIDDHVKKLIADMIETRWAVAGPGGLAAPQVASDLSVFIMTSGSSGADVYINPRIISYEGELFRDESCLSLRVSSDPEIAKRRPVVKRAKSFVWEYTTLEGEQVRSESTFTGFQHEIDHLRGVTVMDRETKSLPIVIEFEDDSIV